MSLGGGRSTTIDNAVKKLVAAGIPAVVAAGNSAADACTSSPAAVTDAVTVAAVDVSSAHAYFSNYGACVDVYAPGVGVYSSINAPDAYATFSGTSMATPHTAGVVALMLAANPCLTPADVTRLLKASATASVTGAPVGTTNLAVNARAAVAAAAAAVSATCTAAAVGVTTSTTGGNTTLTTATTDAGGGGFPGTIGDGNSDGGVADGGGNGGGSGGGGAPVGTPGGAAGGSGGIPSFVIPGSGVPSFVIPGSGIAAGVSPGNSGDTPAADAAANAAAAAAGATAAAEAAQSGDSQAVVDFVASMSAFAQSVAAAAAAGNNAGGAANGGASPAAAAGGAAAPNAGGNAAPNAGGNAAPNAGGAAGSNALGGAAAGTAAGTLPSAATTNAAAPSAAANAAAVSNAAMALLTVASLLNQNVPVSQAAPSVNAQSQTSSGSSVQQQATAVGAASEVAATGIAPDPNGGAPFLAAEAHDARATLLAALSDTLSSAGAPAGAADMLTVATALGAIVAATEFVSPAGAASALSSLALLADAPADVLNASSLAPVAHALGGVIGAAKGFADAGDAGATFWDAGFVLDTLARTQGAALSPGASQSVTSEQFSLLLRSDLPSNATSTLFTVGLSLPIGSANTTIPVAVDPLPAGIFAGVTGPVSTTLLSMDFNPWAASDASSGVSSVTRLSFAAAGGADIAVTNLANALTFSMPSGAVSPLAATNASLQASCVFYNVTTGRYDGAGCVTRPPVFPAGHTLAWSATTGLASDADLVRTWSISGPLVSSGCTDTVIDCATMAGRALRVPLNGVDGADGVASCGGLTAGGVRVFSGAACALWRANNSASCSWDVSRQAFLGAGCVVAPDTHCACRHATDFASAPRGAVVVLAAAEDGEDSGAAATVRAGLLAFLTVAAVMGNWL
jgi:hypothetical protein